MALLLINLPAQAVGLTMNNSVLMSTAPATNTLANSQIKPSSSIASFDNTDPETLNEAIPFSLAQPQIALPEAVPFSLGQPQIAQPKAVPISLAQPQIALPEAVPFSLDQSPKALPIESIVRVANTSFTSENSSLNTQLNTLTSVGSTAIYSQINISKTDVLGEIQNRLTQGFLDERLVVSNLNTAISNNQKTAKNVNPNLEKSLINTPNTISFNDTNLVKQSNTLNLDLGLTKTLNNTAIPHMSALQTSFNGQQLDATNLDGLDSMTNQLISTNTRSQTAIAQWGPVSVTQSAPLLQQAHDMLSPLREQIRFQIDQQIKQAEIRLDPPELGKIELNVRLDGDRLHIQMHAANSVIRDAMLAGLDRLRSDLANDHGGLIDVDVSQGESQNKQQQEPNQPVISIAGMHESAAERTVPPQQDYVDLLA